MSTPEQLVDETVDDTDLDAFNDLLHGKTIETPKNDDSADTDQEDDGSRRP